ncbi:MAG: DUF3618 domain-containing protein [Propionibacteriaceae bacterium]|nr:DUF3618 domain-containing protein [Propionibacteriaceae bacterium]
MAIDRTPEDIEREIADAGQRIADNLASLIVEVHPKAVLHRSIAEGKRKAYETVDDARQFVADTATQVRDQFETQFKDDAGWQWKKLAIAGGVVLAVVALTVTLGTLKKK